MVLDACFWLGNDKEKRVFSSNYWNPGIMRELANYAVLAKDKELLGKILEAYKEYCHSFTNQSSWAAEDWARKESDIQKMKDKLASMSFFQIKQV